MSSEALQRSETFAVGDAARLKLSNIRGRVTIEAGAPGEIAVTAVKRDEALAAATSIELGQSADGTVSVETRYPSSHGDWRALTGRGRPSRVDYTVRVPPACSVELAVVECDTLI